MRKLTKNEMLDGFDVDADEQDVGARRVVQGGKLKFTQDFKWVDNDEEEVSANLELVVVDRARVLQKWSTDGAPLETRFLEPDERWPDVEALNTAAPRSEWREGFGSLVGPWQCQWVIYLLTLLGEKYTYVTGTTVGHMAIGDLSDKIKVMRRLRGVHVHPVVTLSDTFMQTKFGGRQRPHFKVVRWVCLDGDAALPAPEESPRPLPPAQAAEKHGSNGGITDAPAIATAPAIAAVKEPSTEEILDDKVRF
jgi:hypothetical protein